MITDQGKSKILMVGVTDRGVAATVTKILEDNSTIVTGTAEEVTKVIEVMEFKRLVVRPSKDYFPLLKKKEKNWKQKKYFGKCK